MKGNDKRGKKRKPKSTFGLSRHIKSRSLACSFLRA